MTYLKKKEKNIDSYDLQFSSINTITIENSGNLTGVEQA